MHHYPTRPGRVIAAAVLLILYGCLMLVCSACGAIDSAAGNQDMRAVLDKELPATEFVGIAQVCSNLFIGIGMITLGIFVLQLNKFARIGAYIACVYELTLLLVHTSYSVLFEFPVLDRFFAEQARNNADMPGGFMMGAVWLNLAFAIVLTLTVCGLIIIFLSGATARAAFADEFDAPRSRTGRRRYEDYDDDDYAPPPPKSPGGTGITDRLS